MGQLETPSTGGQCCGGEQGLHLEGERWQEELILYEGCENVRDQLGGQSGFQALIASILIYHRGFNSWHFAFTPKCWHSWKLGKEEPQ